MLDQVYIEILKILIECIKKIYFHLSGNAKKGKILPYNKLKTKFLFVLIPIYFSYQA